MPSRVSRSVSRRRSDSAAAFVCGGRSSGWASWSLLSEMSQARRVLPDEKLDGEVEGVQRTGEGPQLRLVDLQAHQLAHAELHPVQAHRAVVVEVGQHEEQRADRAGAWGPGVSGSGTRLGWWAGLLLWRQSASLRPHKSQDALLQREEREQWPQEPRSGPSWVVGVCVSADAEAFREIIVGPSRSEPSGMGPVLRPVIRSSSFFNLVASFSLGGWQGRDDAVPEQGRDALGRQHEDQADHRQEDGGSWPVPPPRSSLPSAIRTKPAQAMAKTARPAAA